jgi:NADP-reducing hydrogenase subunit HndB
MAKLTLDDLKKIRETKKAELVMRSTEGKESVIIIGMGTCGIAAGAKASLDAILDEIEKKGIGTVTVRQTGCMGFCSNEPTVEVIVPGMPATIYGNVDAAVARRIVDEHVMNRKLISEHIFDKPSVDIIK